MTNDGAQTGFAVLSYNVGNGLVPPQRLQEFLKAVDIDVIGLQEVDAAQAAVMDELAEIFPFQEVRGSGFSGRALLSRYPILATEWLDLAPDRPDLLATIELPGTSVRFIVAHPRPPKPTRRGVVFDEVTEAQLDRLAELATEGGPAVLMGDLNMTPRNPGHARLLEAGLIDTQQEAGSGRGATFPLRLGQAEKINHRLSWLRLPAVARVDYIWHTPDLVTQDAWVVRDSGSDHRPVAARIAWREGQ